MRLTGRNLKTSRILLAMMAAALLAGATACKPTERNYRAAYDVAIIKKEREQKEREELRKESGMPDAVMSKVDGAALRNISGRDVWTRHQSFAREDSVKPYAVGVATFRMDTNGKALAADLRAEGWKDSRCVKGGNNWFVIIGDHDTESSAIDQLVKFSDSDSERPYVGQPGILLIVGGSR